MVDTKVDVHQGLVSVILATLAAYISERTRQKDHFIPLIGGEHSGTTFPCCVSAAKWFFSQTETSSFFLSPTRLHGRQPWKNFGLVTLLKFPLLGCEHDTCRMIER